MKSIMQPWPWWISGILIGLTVPMLYILAGKAFGISTSLQQIGSMCSPHSRFEYLRKHDRTSNLWTLNFVIGIALGAMVAARFLCAEPVSLLPDAFRSPAGAARLMLGGVLIGFGTRYAGGCTSGHSIIGIANLNWPSLVATLCFFAGGLAVTWGLSNMLF